uniref:SWIM zinc finger family protein n=1 Tax=Poseidonocella sp. HB161398 TaxID=2320855 RepID=UPI00110A05DA
MTIRLKDQFDPATLARGLDYARRGHVVSVAPAPDGTLEAVTANGRGRHYRQSIRIEDGMVSGDCTCPMEWNCKHVAAAMAVWQDQQQDRSTPALPLALQGWLGRLRDLPPPPAAPAPRGADYPPTVKDRLLYVPAPGAALRIDIHKGRINAAGTALNKAIRRYDAALILRNPAPPDFVRPADLELLPDLMRAGLWGRQPGYSYGRPELVPPRPAELEALIRRLCATGRFLLEPEPGAQIAWSEDRPAPRLGWQIEPDGCQRLVFADAAGAPLDLRSQGAATLWIAGGQIGLLAEAIPVDLLDLVRSSPRIAPGEVEALGATLPARLGGHALPPPQSTRQTRRPARHRMARLTLGAETAREGHRRYDPQITLPVLTLRFVYDGQEVRDSDGDVDPRLVEDGTIVTLARDHGWEAACTMRLMRAGALPVEEMELHWPSERMAECDFAFAESEFNLHAERSGRQAALDFAFRELPALRRDGWEVVETRKWPYRLSPEEPVLSVATGAAPGAAFHGNDWFSLGFRAEIGGQAVDVAPLIAAFLEQARGEPG